MKNKRILSAVLAALMLLSAVSCSDNSASDSSEETETAADTAVTETAQAEEEPAEEEEEKVTADLPDADFGGYTFRMLGKGTSNVQWQEQDLCAEELTGSAINDAVYNRNLKIGDMYNVKFQELAVADYFSQQTELQRSVQAGTDEYDIVTLKPEAVVSSFISNNYLMNLYDVPNMDLSKPYYDQSSITGMSLGGKVYAVMGDMLTMDDDATGAVFFNKQIAADNQLPDLYTMVNEGTWTVDKLYEYSSAAAKDVNGDAAMDEKNDTWGTLTEYATTFSLISGSGYTMITKDETDTPVNTSLEEGYVNMYEKVLKVQNSWDSTLYAESVSGYSDVWTDCMDVIFQSDRALFYVTWLNRASLFREMNTDFGIIPMPKYDDAQENYYSFVHMYCANTICVPVTNADFSRTGFIVEALSAESMYTVKVAYYDKTLTAKNVRDEESSQMLDIIFANRIYDLGYMFNWGGIYSAVGSLAGTNGQDISGYSSAMNKITKSVSKSIKKTMEAIAG